VGGEEVAEEPSKEEEAPAEPVHAKSMDGIADASDEAWGDALEPEEKNPQPRRRLPRFTRDSTTSPRRRTRRSARLSEAEKGKRISI